MIDNRLKVFGVDNLRVADASAWPEIPAAHIMGPTMVLGYLAAKWMLEDNGGKLRYAKKNGEMHPEVRREILARKKKSSSAHHEVSSGEALDENGRKIPKGKKVKKKKEEEGKFVSEPDVAAEIAPNDSTAVESSGAQFAAEKQWKIPVVPHGLPIIGLGTGTIKEDRLLTFCVRFLKKTNLQAIQI